MQNIFNSPAYAMERAIATLCQRITDHGVDFDVPGARELLARMEIARDELSTEIQRLRPPQPVSEWFTPKRRNSKKGYWPGIPFEKKKEVPHNPNSSQQNCKWLQELGWLPTVYTEAGAPCLNAAVLATIDLPEAKLLGKFKTTDKRIGMLEGSEKSWLNVVEPDGRIRCQYYTLGTVTGRCSHSPNVAQVPRIVKGPDGAPLHGADGAWGYECRALFGPPAGWRLVGIDMSGLEMRCLAHALAPFDNGAYVTVVCDGDPHALTQQVTGLDTRAKGKTLNFAVIYGCGDAKAGHIVAPDEDDEYTVRVIGREVRNALRSGIPGFGDLFDWLDRQNQLWGLDDRPLFVRKKFAALNTLLQSTGAIVCKRWLLLIDEELQGFGLVPGRDYEFVLFVHDETQIAARTDEIAEIVALVAKEQAIAAGEYYHMHCPLAAEAVIGDNWAMTH